MYALERNKEISVAAKWGDPSFDHSFRRQVRDGAESQQWADLLSLLGTFSLSPSIDRWVCDLNGDGSFRVKGFRSVLDDLILPSSNMATRWVKCVPVKVNVYAWRARLERLPTRDNLAKRGVHTDSNLCPVYGSSLENIQHLLFGCDLAKSIFRKICRWWNISWVHFSSFVEWDSWFASIRLSSKLKSLLEGVLITSWWRTTHLKMLNILYKYRYFFTDEVFNSDEELKNWAQKKARPLGYVIVTKRSKANTSGFKNEVYLRCDRSGQYKENESSKDTAIRKINCPFMLVGKYSWVYNGWTLIVMCDEHNHPPAQHMEAHPYARRLTTDEYRLVEDLTKKNMEARNILAILKEQNKDNVSTIKDIYNAQSKIRKAQKVEETTMQVQWEYIPLDSVDIFWRTLKVSWSEPVEDDDIQCEELFMRVFDIDLNMQPTRHNSVSNTQTGRMHNLISDLNEEPPRHNSFVNQTSMWHDSSTDEQIEIERLRKQIPKVVHPYILVLDIQNVMSDGNCGFRAVALGLGLSEDQWPRIRSDLVRELEARQRQY
nr:RNA-directed DNA polymerase, eukaryota [Tanacetum cinerariifolium]